MNTFLFSSIIFTVTFLSVKPSSQTTSVELIRVNYTPNASLDIVYVTKRETNSSVHMLWGAFSHSLIPSMLWAHSSNSNDKIEVMYSESNHPSLSLLNVTQSYALAFVKLVEYNDTNDVVNFSTPMEEIKFIKFSELNWKMHTSVVAHDLSEDEVFETDFIGQMGPSGAGGIVITKFMVSASGKRNTASPKLVFLPGMSVQVEVSLIGLKSSYTASRFGLQLAIISNQSVLLDEDFGMQTVQSLDDEFTPGNFKTINVGLASRVDSVTRQPIDLPEFRRALPPAFLQLRPVCYATNGSRDVKSSRNVHFDDRRCAQSPLDVQQLHDSIAFWFYGDRIANESALNTVGIRLQNVSIGTQQDGFYASSNYLVWTLSLGLGIPPEDRFSVLLVALFVFSMVLAIGAIVVGTISAVVVHRRRRQPTFQRLTDSDDEGSTPVA